MPTNVFKGSKIADVIAPSDYIYFKDGKWNTRDFLPGDREMALFSIHNPMFTGKDIRIVFPVEIDSKKVEYSFYFKTIFVNKDDFWVAQKNFF